MRNHFNFAFMLALLILVGYFTYQIFAPFLIAIFLAFIFSHLFRSWYEKFNKRMGGRKSWASFFACLVIFLVFIIPLVLVSVMVVSEANQAYQSVQDNGWKIPYDKLLSHPLASRLGIDQADLTDGGQLSDMLKRIGNFFFEALKKTYQGASHFLFMTVIMFFTLYYLFKDGDAIQKKILNFIPLKNSQKQMLFDRFLSVTKATIKGSLVIASIQAGLLGIIFWITGVTSPVFWAVLTFIFALIPMLGAAVVWLPAGLIMLAIGFIWQGIVILVSGALLISTIDNFLRPALVGNQVQLHPLLVFFATLGGIAVFGLTGILTGPIIVVLFITLLGMYQEEFHKELNRFNAK